MITVSACKNLKATGWGVLVHACLIRKDSNFSDNKLAFVS